MWDFSWLHSLHVYDTGPDCDLRDPEPEPPSWAPPKHLTHRNYEIIFVALNCSNKEYVAQACGGRIPRQNPAWVLAGRNPVHTKLVCSGWGRHMSWPPPQCTPGCTCWCMIVSSVETSRYLRICVFHRPQWLSVYVNVWRCSWDHKALPVFSW